MSCGGCGKKKKVTNAIDIQQQEHQNTVLSNFMKSRRNIVRRTEPSNGKPL